MTWTLSVISGNVEYDLSDGETYILTALDGVGMAPVARIAERGPLQHGESDLGFRLEPRKIALAFVAKGGDDPAAWFAVRHDLLRIFRPSDTPLQLRIASGEMTRQFDCHFSGAMGLAPEFNLAPRWQRVVVELTAPDPTAYDPSGESITYGISGSGQSMIVPLEVPWMVGASDIGTTRQVAYAGTWDAFPVITIRGPITDCIILNETLGDKLDFTGITIPAEEQYVVDCRYGYKTVTRQSDGANRVQELTSDSNLATFRIGAHPQPLDGLNSIRVSGVNITAGTEIFIQFNARYVGV